jgi:hypothetical protein
MNLESVTEDVNEKHMQPWSDLCKDDSITATPLTPYLDKELLKDNEMSINGQKIASFGFTYETPKMTTELLQQVIDDFRANRMWPAQK